MENIKDLWIVNPYGVTIFNYSKTRNRDNILIGGFFSGIHKFLKEIRNEELKLIISGKSKFMIYQSHGGFLFISRSGNKIKDKDIIKNLKLIEIEFFGRYEDKIRQWNGEVGHFDKFKTIIVKFNGRS